jgi:hypothetical protein
MEEDPLDLVIWVVLLWSMAGMRVGQDRMGKYQDDGWVVERSHPGHPTSVFTLLD